MMRLDTANPSSSVPPQQDEDSAPQEAQLRWYILQVHSGFEVQVQKDIQDMQRDNKHLEQRIGSVKVPTERVVGVRRGVRHQSERKFFPGYVLVEADLDDIVSHELKNLPKVMGFLGPKGHPVALRKSEEQRMLRQMDDGVSHARPAVTFEIGEKVRVSHGPFSSFNGIVEDVDEERARLKVSVSIFGRSTPVELEYGQVEKI